MNTPDPSLPPEAAGQAAADTYAPTSAPPSQASTAFPATVAAPQPTPSPAPAAHSANALPIGHQLHEFEITGLVGEGGFGIVYLARDTQLQRTVAIKEYMPHSLASRAGDLSVNVRSERQRDTFNLGLRSFVNEARLLASFDHPALIKVYRFWEANGTAYMVMPYYQGPTLKGWLREQSQPPDEAWLKALLAPLLDALEAIHADHCYHRDIAPDNILLLGPSKPLLLDFGAARRVIGDATQALTVILKPGYAPVEQYAEVPSMKQGPWTDVYALCAVLYAAINGKAPPPSVGRLMKDDMMPLSQAAKGRYSPAFLQAIDAGLTVHPEQRPRDVAVLRERLFAESPLMDAVPAEAAPIDLVEDDERTQMLPPDVAPAAQGATPSSSPPSSLAAALPVTQGSPSDTYTQTLHVPRAEASADQGQAPVARPGHAAQASQSGDQASAPARSMALPVVAGLLALGMVGGGAWWLSRSGQTTQPAGGGADMLAASAMSAATASASQPLATTTAGIVHAAASNAASNAATLGAPANTSAGTMAPSTSAARAPRPPFSIAAALEDIVRHADPLMAVNTLTNKSQLTIGRDKLLFQVKSSVPGYLYVYLAGTDQSHFYLLFPNALDKRNHIEANTLVELPRKGWHITAGGPPGVNHIVTVVSPHPRDLGQLGLNTKDSIPEFDIAQATRLWASYLGAGSPFVGAAQCEGTPASAPCEQGYGASLVHIEEVN
jgi:serine/threonine protein kinase